MIYLFNYYQKTLENYRENNFETANHFLNKISNDINNLNSISKIGMDLVYYPVIAYKEYKFKNYEMAFYYIDIAINKGYELIDNNFNLKDALLAILEQNFNKIKILIKLERIYDVIDISSQMILYLTNGEKNNLIKISFNKFINENYAYWYEIVSYYVDSIIILLINCINKHSFNFDVFFEILLEKINMSEIKRKSSGYNNFTYTLSLLCNNWKSYTKETKYEKGFKINLDFIPLSIKYLLLYTIDKNKENYENKFKILIQNNSQSILTLSSLLAFNEKLNNLES